MRNKRMQQLAGITEAKSQDAPRNIRTIIDSLNNAMEYIARLKSQVKKGDGIAGEPGVVALLNKSTKTLDKIEKQFENLNYNHFDEG